MIRYLEESLSAKAFSGNLIPECTIAVARTVLDDANGVCKGLNSGKELELLYASIDPVDPDADLKAATCIVSASIYLHNSKWKIHGNEYTWTIVPRVLQIAAALELCKTDKRKFAVQPTGEGKTITALVAIAILALKGSVHIITANDYLASRDCQWIGPVLDILGIQRTFLDHDFTGKSAHYAARVIFGSDKEFLFDYLRDSIRPPDVSKMCNERMNVLVDEGDHILLDELMTPAIISKEHDETNPYLHKADAIVRTLTILQEKACNDLIKILNAGSVTSDSKEILSAITSLRYSGKSDTRVSDYLKKNKRMEIESQRYEFKQSMKSEDSDWYTQCLYYEVNVQEKSCAFTDKGMHYIEKKLDHQIFTLPEFRADTADHLSHFQLLASLQNALMAYTLLIRDVDYIVRKSKIEVLTTSIGRADSLKRFGHDLAGAVAVKEHAEFSGDTSSVTRTTIAGFVKEYRHCAVLSGTLVPDHAEFETIYGAKAFPVPVNKPLIVKHHQGKIFPDNNTKCDNIIEDVLYFHEFGRPVLIGTHTIINSEEIARKLRAKGVPVRLLCAKNEEEEPAIIALAGDYGAVTVATNMAGRGCDIIVSEDSEINICQSFIALMKQRRSICSSISIQCESKYESDFLCNQLNISRVNYTVNADSRFALSIRIDGNAPSGFVTMRFGLGLYVIVSEFCVSRRIEMQLRGRTGRQGRPGSSTLFTSLQDEALMLVPSVRWFGLWINSWCKWQRHPVIMQMYLWMTSLSTEGHQRFLRHEQLFFDYVSEIFRMRTVEIREKTIKSECSAVIQGSIHSFIEYLNEETMFVNRYEDRISFVTSRLQTVFSLHGQQLPGTVFNLTGSLDVRAESWLSGLLTTRDIRHSKDMVIAHFCSCIDDAWHSFSTSLESSWEQAHLFGFAGRDPRTTFVDITFAKWHEVMYRLQELFLVRLFVFEAELKEKVKLTTSSADNELEALMIR
ncbi:MAG: hypothetical protein JW915_11115 [Chitinispirillaceae bacterium]|nr:hypothetical protein [Chitinispirillaceae bacterium]